jgi:hypothetical protein
MKPGVAPANSARREEIDLVNDSNQIKDLVGACEQKNDAQASM